MKKSLFLLLISFFVTSAFSKNNPVNGKWLMTGVEKDGKQQETYSILNFTEDGTFVVNEIPLGTWTYKSGVVTIKSKMSKKVEGTYKVSSKEKNKISLSGENMVMLCKKYDQQTIGLTNSKSGLTGTWNLPLESGKRTMIFKQPDLFTVIDSEEGMTSTTKGTWIYDEKENTLILIALSFDLKGKSEILQIDDNSFSFEHDGNIFKATKKIQPKIAVERLQWKDDDFYTNDGDFKYQDDENKLPWNNPEQIEQSYQNITQLTYNFYKLLDDKQTFDKKELIAKINVERNDTPNVSDIFKGRNTEDVITFDDLKYIFPVNCEVFRYAGTEKLTTPAGTFDCTIIEAMGDFDEKVKIWMINDKPGMVAKIIKDQNDDSFGHYYVFLLNKIK